MAYSILCGQIFAICFLWWKSQKNSRWILGSFQYTLLCFECLHVAISFNVDFCCCFCSKPCLRFHTVKFGRVKTESLEKMVEIAREFSAGDEFAKQSSYHLAPDHFALSEHMEEMADDLNSGGYLMRGALHWRFWNCVFCWLAIHVFHVFVVVVDSVSFPNVFALPWNLGFNQRPESHWGTFLFRMLKWATLWQKSSLIVAWHWTKLYGQLLLYHIYVCSFSSCVYGKQTINFWTMSSVDMPW